MKKIVLLLGLCLPLIIWAQTDSILSGVYTWKAPGTATQKNIFSTTLFEGKAYDMEWLQMSANSIQSSKQKIKQQVPANEEHLLIVKSGTVTIMINDSTWTIGAGSLALLMPGEKYTIQNNGTDACNFYELKYRSKEPVDLVRAKNAGGSLVSNWNNIAFISNNNGGGRRNFFNRPSAMTKRFEIHVTTLKEGVKSHEPHTHQAEEIIVVINNKTEMQIADQMYKGSEGSIYYLGSNILHGIKNDGIGPCTYFAIQFE
jgi:(S)-ureidoglycine aminohydrolase